MELKDPREGVSFLEGERELLLELKLFVVVLATRKAGSDLPDCLPPNLSPLPVSVHTHSLNLSKIQFIPNLFFCFIFIFISLL